MDQRIAHELVEGHHHRHRVARQAEEECLADPAERHRPAGAHGDFPEQHFAELRHQLLHEVCFPYGDPSGRDHHVRRLGLAERLLQQSRIVAHHAHVDDLDAQARQHAVQRVAVRVVDLAFLERLADRGQLVAGGEERHAQAALDLDRADAERRDQADLGGPDQAARRQDGFSLGQVFARVAHVLRLLLPGRDGDAITFSLHDFLNHHRVGALRHHRTGHDAHAFAGAELAGEGFAGQGCADLPQGIFFKIGETHRVAVHRRVVVGGHVDLRHDVLREHAA
jgi:hypothetical protein